MCMYYTRRVQSQSPSARAWCAPAAHTQRPLAPVRADDLGERSGADGVNVVPLMIPDDEERLGLVLAGAPPAEAGVARVVRAVHGDRLGPRLALVLGAGQDELPEAALLGPLGFGPC